MSALAIIKEPIQFECQGSAKCCVSRGSYGFVYLTLEDRRRLARFFRLSTAQFTKRHCDKADGYFHLRDAKGPCKYLEGNRCQVYYARPGQCRRWPFWPENMGAKTWEQIAAFCPGVGTGPTHSPEQIQSRLEADEAEWARAENQPRP